MYIYFHLSIHQLMKGLDWSLQIMQLSALPYKFFHRPCFHFLQVYSKEWNCWVIYSYSSYVLNILPKLPNCFPEYLYHILIPLVIYGVPFSLHLCQHLLLTNLEVWSSTSYFFFWIFLLANNMNILSYASWSLLYHLWRTIYSDALLILFSYFQLDWIIIDSLCKLSCLFII